ncbi:MAG TPA: dihydroorotate dehydrogenase [Candidatus Dormibacteraeota bacterium]|jgi:dihydroorotate dehydrogenase (NAD+) catalytic subunit|nr:dihydroorotate dehydrogenase [Candidatus Dormibacteraeota bacterium]
MSGESTVDLRVPLGRGVELPNPVGVASGTFGYGFEFEQLIDIQRLGAIYTKGTTPQPREGNPPPRVAETAGGMLNSIGLQNPGVDHVARVYAQSFAQWRVPVIVNVAAATVDEYVHCVRVLDTADGIAGYELNISCPNIAHGMDFGLDATAAGRLVGTVRGATERCLVVKLSPNVTDIAAVARAVEDSGADAVSAVNTYVGMKVHLAMRRPVLPNRGTGGLSGPAIKPLALAAVARVRAAVRIPVIGVGGIATATDALEHFVAGADAVQVGTASFADPRACLDILDGITAYAQRAGLARLTDLRWQPAPLPA